QATNDADFTVTDALLRRSGLTDLSLASIENFNLTGGNSNNNFDVSGWSGTGSLAGGSGTDNLIATNDADFTVTNSLLQRSGRGNVNLASMENFNLTGGNSNNNFDVSGWSGTGSLTGGGGTDTVQATNDVNFTIIDTRLTRFGLADITLASIENFNLTGGNG